MSGSNVSEQPRIVKAYGITIAAATITGAGDWALLLAGVGSPTGAAAGQGLIDWRPTDWTLYDRTTYWRLRLWLRTAGTVAPTGDVYATLYDCSPGTTAAGALSLGTELAGARGPTKTLSANATAYELTTPTVAAPAAGAYVAILHTSAAWAATSGAILTGSLEAMSR